ncbi:Non-heme chloroperoxidase [Mycobacterium talmoniae]|uniref:Non-heme chloroperoxidase n=1 Tax=Mycobacterium talmoniae TaxID=1858794 RepID=A0A2S8BDG1_9MYCO|nr:Non-heme chloroperoxidase [Mycobacterium talmoniae]
MNRGVGVTVDRGMRRTVPNPPPAPRRPGLFARLFRRITRHPLAQAIAHYLNRRKRNPQGQDEAASGQVSGPVATRIVHTRDGVALAVREHGSRAAGHTVVLLHGWCMNKDAWNIQVSQLIRQWGDDVRIIGYDHRGHGDSAEAPVHTYHVDRLAEDLAEVLVALDVTGMVTFVGHSMGGMTALAYLGRPAHLRPVEPHHVVLVATAAGKVAERGIGRLLKPAPRTSSARSGTASPGWRTRSCGCSVGRCATC